MDSKKQKPDPNYLMLSVDYGSGKKYITLKTPFVL
ncbi:MPPV-350 hypothetical protein [Magpiepox virus 2]|nr:MPPV-003 hypothetical protein [Magpiepox virus 2]QZW33682.1 MPPV-350 hypothetical protein [Magpiepox virus 2]